MKKSLFFAAAASALMLTACSSENDVVQTADQLQQSAPKAVGFDVYTQDANEVTRGGYEGIMNTTRLQGIANGFGIFGYYTDTNDGDATPKEYPFTTPATSGSNNYVPNFMWNQQVRWNNTNKGWAYAPLKYWPNETINDSQSNPEAAYMEDNSANGRLDRLSFFAYAPYVTDGADDYGITAITQNNGKLTTTAVTPTGARDAADPAIEYVSAITAAKSVDLLWGVAPAGGQHYTAVDGNSNGADTGMPYLNLTKPDVNTSLKFYFQHALARFGFTVAAAIDQVPQGGNWPSSAENPTRITVESVKLSGYFGTKGILNLNNPYENIANWINLGSGDLAAASTVGTAPLELKSFTISGADINTTIKDSGTDAVQTVTGVTTAKKDLVQGKFSKVDSPTEYSTSAVYYTSAGEEIHATMANSSYYTYNSGTQTYTLVSEATINSPDYPNAIPAYFTITPGDKLTTDPGATHGIAYKKVGDTFEYFMDADTDMSGVDYSAADYYIPSIVNAGITEANFSYSATEFYLPERSYFMVIPTNNVEKICTTGVTDDADKNLLKTVWVEITYYVTTEDANLGAGFSRVKNVIKKKVELPSLANGKSYNLHLLLGLTSVKVEAEVGDWKEVYVQTDLPQNTPGE